MASFNRMSHTLGGLVDIDRFHRPSGQTMSAFGQRRQHRLPLGRRPGFLLVHDGEELQILLAEWHDQIGGAASGVMPSVQHGEAQRFHPAAGGRKVGDKDDRLYEPVLHTEILPELSESWPRRGWGLVSNPHPEVGSSGFADHVAPFLHRAEPLFGDVIEIAVPMRRSKMKVKRATITLVSASIVVMAALAVVPSTAFASPSKSLWVNSAATVTVPGKSCTTPGFNTVQAAINAAPAGATIHICSGSGPYVEQLSITQPVSLVAAGSGVTIALPTADASASTLHSTTACDTAPGTGAFQADEDEISICTTGHVNITGITVQALWPADTCYDSMFGILVAGGADLKMTNSTMEGAGGSPFNGCQGGVGIQVGMAWTTPVEVGHATLKNVTVEHYQKNGITVDGAGSTATVNASTVTTAPTDQLAQNGIQISNGAQGKITDSSVSGDECNEPSACGSDSLSFAQSTGVLFYGAAPGTSVTHSSISGSDIGVYSFDAAAAAPTTPNATVSNDTLSGDRYEAVALDQGSTVVSNDTISGGNVGIQILQYAGAFPQAYGVTAVAKNDKISGMAVAAAQIYSDNAVSGDLPGSLSISKSKISGNPGSITGSILDNSPAYAAYSVTLKKDT